MKYPSGEDIRKGDQAPFHGEPGENEFVAEAPVGDPVIDWNVKHNSLGVMLLEPRYFGRVYLPASEASQELEFVSRAADKPQRWSDPKSRFPIWMLRCPRPTANNHRLHLPVRSSNGHRYNSLAHRLAPGMV